MITVLLCKHLHFIVLIAMGIIDPSESTKSPLCTTPKAPAHNMVHHAITIATSFKTLPSPRKSC